MPENKLFNEIKNLETEQRNPASENIDVSSTAEILGIINNEDKIVPEAVAAQLGEIEKAVDVITDGFKSGGRLIYAGAGTSGRLGIVDAAECPPTFGTDPKMVQGLIAGGKEAVFVAQEGAEDKPENGSEAINKLNVTEKDVVCGIAASGRTPYVKGALLTAKELGASTILITTISSRRTEELGMDADIKICVDVGPEVITGSTRMKSGTAQKLVLNMLTTASMIKLGKTLGNVMVDLQLTNAKLTERAKGVLMSLGGVSYDEAGDYLNKSGGHVKTALVMILTGSDAEDAGKKLKEAGGFIKNIIKPAGN